MTMMNRCSKSHPKRIGFDRRLSSRATFRPRAGFLKTLGKSFGSEKHMTENLQKGLATMA